MFVSTTGTGPTDVHSEPLQIFALTLIAIFTEALAPGFTGAW
jgi:hypothetical protein